MYRVNFSDEAEKEADKLMRDEPKAYKKLERLVAELKVHPTTGTGKSERFKGDKRSLWSRRITDKHRLIYSIGDDILTVYVLSSAGHYTDK